MSIASCPGPGSGREDVRPVPDGARTGSRTLSADSGP